MEQQNAVNGLNGAPGTVPFEAVTQATDTDPVRLRMLHRIYEGGDAGASVTVGAALLLLVSDLLDVSGMPMERYAPALTYLRDRASAFGEELVQRLTRIENGIRALPIPRALLIVADNRYVCLYDTVTDGDASTWDTTGGGHPVTQADRQPVTTLTIDLTGLYLATVARASGHAAAADSFQRNMLGRVRRKPGEQA